MTNQPQDPTDEILTTYLKRWDALDNYVLQENSLSLLFHNLCPRNEKIESILLKVSSLNAFYSTHIYDIYSVVKHILSLEIDERLRISDLSLVNAIAKVTIKNKEWHFYSFATKYCSHHMAESYPIYDSYVEKMLVFFKKKTKFSDFKKSDLRTYEHFVESINAFRSFFKLEKFSLREIDIYLWLVGKETFPINYK